MRKTERIVGGRSVRLTSLDRVLFPSTGFTKRDLIDYYAAVADVLLPHTSGRPLTLGRWPAGVDEPGFAQTECRGAPEWVRTLPVQLHNGTIRNYCAIDDLPSLLWAANLGTIELHAYVGGGADARETSAAVFDLDPAGGAGLLDAARFALALREALARSQLDAVTRTTGGAGVHVLVPLNRPHSFDDVRAFCKDVAKELDTTAVRIDCAENHARRLLIAPYSLRATARPTVAAPLLWDEIERAVERGRPDELVFTAAEMPDRIAQIGDAHEPLLHLTQRLPV